MTQPRRTFLLVLLVGLLAGSGCAARNAGPRTGANTATLRIESVPAVGALTIYLLSETGARRLVGHVSAGQDAVLTFDVPGRGSYRFLAETLSRQTAVSNALSFAGGATIHWNLTSNVAIIAG